MKPFFARLQHGFFAYGWLLPAWLPLAQVGGRGLANSLFGLYLLWGLLAIYRRLPQVPRPVSLLYLGVLGAFILGVPTAQDSAAAIEQWLNFALHTSAFFLTFAVLQSQPAKLDQLLRNWAWAGLSLLVLLYLILPFLAFGDDFRPDHQLKEDNLPFLLAFAAYFLQRGLQGRARNLAILAVLAAGLFYIALSHGRAALLGLAVAAVVYGVWVLRWKRWRVALGAVLVIGVGVIFSANTFFRDVEEGANWVEKLDRFTSYRTEIWRHALQHPPEPLVTGVGMGNARHYTEIMALSVGSDVKHLHNFLFDAWYETGLLGLGFLLLFLGYMFGKALMRYRYLRHDDAEKAGVLLAAGAAILSAALLSFSYGSRQFSIYLFVILAALVYVTWFSPAKDSAETQ